MDEMTRIVREYRQARIAAGQAVREQYPVGTEVVLLLGAAPAVVHKHNKCCPDLVDLLFENGNVWTKTVDQFRKK